MAARKAVAAAAAARKAAAAAAAAAAAEDAAAPGVAVAYLKQQVSEGKPLTAAQLNQVGIALSKLPQDRLVAIIEKQRSLDPNPGIVSRGTFSGEQPGLQQENAYLAGLDGWFTSIRDSIESVAASPITIFAPNSFLAKTVSRGAQAKAITMVRLRDATEAVASVVANYWVPGISVVLAKYVVSKGANEKLNSKVGKIIQAGTSIAGGVHLLASPAGQSLLSSAKTELASKIPTTGSMITGAETAAKTKATELIQQALTPSKPTVPTAPSLSVTPAPAQPAPAGKGILPIVLGALSLLAFLK